MFLWIAASALAAELVVGEPTDTRRYKIEAVAMQPTEGKRYDLDWLPTNMTFWSMLLECKRTGKRTDTCTFVDGKLEFGYLVRGQEEIKRYELDAPEGLELEYTKLGKVKIDLKGKVDDFHATVADATLGRYHKPENTAWSPDQKRVVGQGYTDDLRFWLGGAFEVQLPRDKSGQTGWKADVPLVARSWGLGTMGGTGDHRILGNDGPVVFIQNTGRFGEALMNSNLHSKGVYEAVHGWDAARGAPVATRIDVDFEVHLAGWETKRVVLMSEAREGMSFKAGELDGSPMAGVP